MSNKAKKTVVSGLFCLIVSFMLYVPKAEAGCWNRNWYSSCCSSCYSSCYYPSCYSSCYYPSYSYCYYPTYSYCYYPTYSYCYYPTYYYSYCPIYYSSYPSWSYGSSPIQSPVVPKSVPSDRNGTATSYIKPVSTARHIAYFDVAVPADAKVYVNDHLTKKTGEYRTYQSYLAEDVDHSFSVRAEIIVDGTKFEQTKTLTLRDGSRGFLSFDLTEDDASDADLRLTSK